jgi:16S rRNA (uracil1498-N3)-methyltransferase
MARRRFFVPEIKNGRARLEGEQAQHLTRVLRVEVGQQYEITDQVSAHLAEVIMARRDLVEFETKQRLAPPKPEVQIFLLAALIKFDAFEWMIEKATELGVTAIVPFIAVRSEKGLEKAAAKRIGRWRKIALEASQQCRRFRVPEVELPIEFPLAVDFRASHRIMLEEELGPPPLMTCAPADRQARDSVALMVGPEGGWTELERMRLQAAGWTSASLGPRVLRAETAALAALAVLGALWQIQYAKDAEDHVRSR